MSTRMLSAMVLVALAGAIGGTARAGLDYFAVNSGGSDDTTYVFTYDTVAKTVALVYKAPWVAVSGANHPSDRVSAGADYSFWTGGSMTAAAGGVERFTTADKLAWTSSLQVTMYNETGAQEFYDSTVRGAVNAAPVGCGAAELADGTVFAGESRINAYGVGSHVGHIGDDPAIWTADAQHLGILAAPGLGGTGSNGENAADVASTVAGAANRFAVTGVEGNDHTYVYNSDGTFKAELTDLGTLQLSGLGSMKTAPLGDVILQLTSSHGTSPTIQVEGRWVTDALFDQVAISAFNVNKPGSGDFFFRATDVDGTESGLIMVVGHVLSPDRVGVWFFDTAGNPTTTNPFDLSPFDSHLVGRTNASGAGLFAAEGDGELIPEPGGAALLLLGGALGLRRRRR